MIMRRSFFIVICFATCSSLLNAKTSSTSPKSSVVKITDSKRDAAQVRIPLSLRPHHTIQIRSPQGELLTQTKPGEEINFTLRAKVNQSNHFYFAGYHVESVPTLWKQEVREYAVKLNFYRTSSINNDVEEKVGSLDVQGHLVAHQDKTFNLVADRSTTFKTPEGQNILAVKAGFSIPNESPAKPPLVSRSDVPKPK